MLKHDDFMKLALNEAKKCSRKKEIPVGAIIVDEFKNIISKGYNKVEEKNNPLFHAEKIAIDKALLKTNKKYFLLFFSKSFNCMDTDSIANK